MNDCFSILIVDDNQSMANTLADILEFKGYKVHIAYSGSKALEILQQYPIDVLLTDVKMPNMNGLELYRKTRQLYPQLITVFMTAYTADDLIKQGMAEGIKTVLDKPVEIKFLLLLFSAYKRINSGAG
jgi:CheY-like chemotaxis protein